MSEGIWDSSVIIADFSRQRKTSLRYTTYRTSTTTTAEGGGGIGRSVRPQLLRHTKSII